MCDFTFSFLIGYYIPEALSQVYLGERLSFSCPPDSFKTHDVDKQFEGAAGMICSKRRAANFTLRFTQKPSHMHLKP